MRGRRGAAVVGLAAMALLACSTPAPESAQSPPATRDDLSAAVAAQSPAPAYERKLRERLQALTRQGRLADAALTAETLCVLRPDVPEYRDSLAELRRQIDVAVADRMQRAAAAQKRGELDAATQQYLAALALQPDQPLAADALRAIERERNKRNYLGKYSRFTLTKRSMAEATVPVSAPESNELEHASILASQGDIDDAIAVLEKRLAADRRDESARQLLGDVYVQKAEAVAPRDRKAAIATLDKALRLDPSNARATALQKQLKGAAGAPSPAASGPAKTR